MPIKVTCPKCQGVLHAPDDAGGKRGKCPTCGTVLAIPADAPKVPAPPGPDVGRPVHAPEPVPRLAETGAVPEGDVRRSSFGAMPRPADVDARRGSAGRLPPPAFNPPEPRKLPDPFAKPGPRPAPGVPGDQLVRAWRRTRRGLGLVRFALFLFLLTPLGLAGIAIAESVGTKLPSQDPGYLKVPGLSTDTEIKAAVALVPVVLGLLVMLLGRFGVSNAPRSSFAKGLATAAAVATLVVVLGAAAFLAPTGVQVSEGFVPDELLPRDNINGIIQRVGIGVTAVFAVLAELWFVAALGRMGAGLHDPRLAGRGTRLLVLGGFLALVALVVGLVALEDRAASTTEARYSNKVRADRPLGEVFQAREVERSYQQYVQPQWDKLGDKKPVVRAAAVGVVGLVLWLWYTRLVGAGRRAIREWLEQYEPAA